MMKYIEEKQTNTSIVLNCTVLHYIVIYSIILYCILLYLERTEKQIEVM